MTPVAICGLIVLSLLTLFFVILITLAMIRILRASNHDYYECEDSSIAVDILVSEPIEIAPEIVAKDQKVALQEGMSVVVAHNQENNGLYVVDADQNLIRVDCLRNQMLYQIKNGKYAETTYKHLDQTFDNHISAKHVLCNASECIKINKNVVICLLICNEHVKDIVFDIDSQSSCKVEMFQHPNQTITIKTQDEKTVFQITASQTEFIIIDGQLRKI